MRRGHLWADLGATGEMLLGAMVDAGASVEAVDEAVRTLGVGEVRLAWGRVPRGDGTACLVRVRAPEETPDVGSWPQVRRILEFAALEDGVRDRALAAAETLVVAEARAAGLGPDQLALPPVGVLDALATIIGTCAAHADLGIEDLTIGVIGVGRGQALTALGEVEVPAAATRELLDGFDLEDRGVPAELTNSVGASLLRTLARPGAPPAGAPARSGVGAGDRVDGLDPVLQLDLYATS